jgi:SAM-dependent methyltransferase
MGLHQEAYVEDVVFDRELPLDVREQSPSHWTPIRVAARVAAICDGRGVSNLLDAGCGPGKFSIVAGRLRPNLDIHGVDSSPRLVNVGRRVANHLGASNVRFSVADVTRLSWRHYDGLYFFNPFAENLPADDEQPSNANEYLVPVTAELLRVTALLAGLRVGTVVVTYHGLGAPIPPSYDLVEDEKAGTDRIRVWVKGSTRQHANWRWFEAADQVFCWPVPDDVT